MEVCVERPVWALDGVGDAGGVQVDAQHLGALAILRPRSCPDGLAILFIAEVVPQQAGHVGGQRLHLLHATLVPAGRQGDSWRLVVEVKGLRRQAGQTACPVAAPAGHGVQVETILSSQTAIVAIARACRGQ
ncbi:MAG TPA: hypothetical protein VMF69_00110 [Gemmataceae bacterium]|nr:hypothetical protein [Gemmataceae bacterium]